MKIGNVEIQGKAVLAPLAGITDLPFRLLCKEQGAALVYTEMISAEGLIRRQPATVDILETRPEEKPVSFQLFGRKPESMAEAARIISGKGADLIDINMGCPVKKVVRGGSGAALLKDLNEAVAVIKAVVSASSVPVTIKVRAGWSPNCFVAAELARAAEGAGVAAIAVHGRYASQGFSGHADWSTIKAVKDAVSIPVMGNGDIVTAMDAKRMIDETGCDLVMVGRGTLGNPWIFREINEYLESGNSAPHPDRAERCEMLLRHMRMMTTRRGEVAGVRVMRKHAAWYSKGLHGSPEFRNKINHALEINEFEEAVKEFFAGQSPAFI